MIGYRKPQAVKSVVFHRLLYKSPEEEYQLTKGMVVSKRK